MVGFSTLSLWVPQSAFFQAIGGYGGNGSTHGARFLWWRTTFLVTISLFFFFYFFSIVYLISLLVCTCTILSVGRFSHLIILLSVHPNFEPEHVESCNYSKLHLLFFLFQIENKLTCRNLLLNKKNKK